MPIRAGHCQFADPFLTSCDAVPIVRAVHDLFDILGVAPHARASDIRQACRRRRLPSHPDVTDEETLSPRAAARAVALLASVDRDLGNGLTPVDFARVGPLVGRIRAAFFGESR